MAKFLGKIARIPRRIYRQARKILTPILVLVTAIFLSGCATPYKAVGLMDGYREIQLATDVYRITFGGNGYTSPERTQDFAMLRASELALQQGFTHFAIIDERNSQTAHSFTTPGQATTTGSAYRYGNQTTYSGYTTYTSAQTHTFYKPKTGLLVQFFKTKPEGIFAFNASFLQQSIRQTYGIE